MKQKMWIMIAGPYRSGSKSHWKHKMNLLALNCAALEVFEKGHIPIIGVNCALPVIDVVLDSTGADRFDEIMMPLSLALTERCDACLRIGDESVGADREVKEFIRMGKPVYYSVDDVPDAS